MREPSPRPRATFRRDRVDVVTRPPAPHPAPTWRRVASPVGQLLLVSDGRSLSGLYLEGDRGVPRPAGARPDDGTPFQLRVWRALCQIPYGETRTYGEIAAEIGHPRAARAVGAANGQNPISTVVPCHRLIGANGSLTGYGGGLAAKAALLELEAAASAPRAAGT